MMSHLLAGLAWLALGIALVLARERVFQPAVAAHEHFWGRLGVRILRVPATIYDEGLADARAANPYHYVRSGQSRVTPLPTPLGEMELPRAPGVRSAPHDEIDLDER